MHRGILHGSLLLGMAALIIARLVSQPKTAVAISQISGE